MTFVLLFTPKHSSNEADRIDISRHRNGRYISRPKRHLGSHTSNMNNSGMSPAWENSIELVEAERKTQQVNKYPDGGPMARRWRNCLLVRVVRKSERHWHLQGVLSTSPISSEITRRQI